MGLISRINARHSANMTALEEKAAAMRARNAERDTARRAERAALVERAEVARAGLVAEHAGVRLFEDRVERKGESHPLPGVRARVEEHRTGQEWGGWDQKDVWLTISGPGFEWPIRTNAIVSSRKTREFAAKVNAAATAGARR
jgi:hypothetical protein